MDRAAVDLTVVFRHAAAEYLLDISPAAGVVDASLALLGTGVDAPSLLEIGSAEPSSLHRHELTGLIEQSLAELRLVPLSTGELSLVRTRSIASRICNGLIDPVAGVAILWSGRSEYGDPYEVLGELIELVDDWESDISGRPAITHRITEIACEISGPRPA